MSEWLTTEKAQEYLGRAEGIPHRQEGEAVLLEFLPSSARRVLDLGCGAGRMGKVVLSSLPEIELVGLDFSTEMLKKAQETFRENPGVQLILHDMNDALPEMGQFDVVVSSFSIHHLPHERTRTLYREVYDILNPGGVFLNLEHVASPTPELHQQFLDKLGKAKDMTDLLQDVETQLGLLRQTGFEQVDCHWKWRELALLAGQRSNAS
ncbi:MAG: class I SAM-dependent methyltransferase [Armatimonadetes bacterium]|nr:class I SAM-dependent methyltransferase [Armatimonadota bacterium]